MLGSWANRLQLDNPMTTRRQPFRNPSETLWQTVGSSQLVTITNPLATCGQPVDKPSAAWQPIGNVLAATRWKPVRNTLCTPFGDTKEPPGILSDPPSTHKDSRIHQGPQGFLPEAPRDQPGSGGGGESPGKGRGRRVGQEGESEGEGRQGENGRGRPGHVYVACIRTAPRAPSAGRSQCSPDIPKNTPPSHPHATQDIQK